jgi:hypothetical protein
MQSRSAENIVHLGLNASGPEPSDAAGRLAAKEIGMFRRIGTLAAPFVLSATIAPAITFSTPNLTVGLDQSLECGVVNVGKTPAKVSLSWFDSFGRQLDENSNNCPLRPLNPLESCTITTPDRNATCVVESSSAKVQAAITVRDLSSRLIDVIPATK